MRRPVIALALALAGCGDNLEAEPDADTVAVEPDAGEADAPAPDPEPCMAPAPLGEVTALTEGEAVLDLREVGDPPWKRIDYNGRIGETTMLRLVLREGDGAFATGFAAGTYTIGATDANVATCGLCTMLVTRFFEPGHSQYLVVQRGTITIDRVDEVATGRLVGSATGLELARVLWDEGAQAWMPSADCTTQIDQVGFDVPLTPGPFWEE